MRYFLWLKSGDKRTLYKVDGNSYLFMVEGRWYKSDTMEHEAWDEFTRLGFCREITEAEVFLLT